MFNKIYMCYINCIYEDEIQQFVRFESLYISHPATNYLMCEKNETVINRSRTLL